MPIATIDVYDVAERCRENFVTARTHLIAGKSDNTGDYGRMLRINAKAQQLADERTKRQVGPDAWREFTNWRARPLGRPQSKTPDYIKESNPTRRGRRARWIAENF